MRELYISFGEGVAKLRASHEDLSQCTVLSENSLHPLRIVVSEALLGYLLHLERTLHCDSMVQPACCGERGRRKRFCDAPKAVAMHSSFVRQPASKESRSIAGSPLASVISEKTCAFR